MVGTFTIEMSTPSKLVKGVNIYSSQIITMSKLHTQNAEESYIHEQSSE